MKSIPQSIERRRFLQTGATLALGATLLPITSARAARNTSAAAGGFRFVFMPCIHLREDLRSPEGLAAALKKVAALDAKPQFILTGGDVCHNLRDLTVDQAEARADLLLKVLKEHASFPMRHCLGNHDLAGWSKPELASDPRYGKKLLQQKLRLEKTYYSFDHGGWHFAVLDYLLEKKPGEFVPEFGPEQLQWLKSDLAGAGGKPVVIVSHAPVVSAVELFTDRAKDSEAGRVVPYGRVVKDTPALFEAVKGANVRTFISGHLHLLEDLRFNGHRFICSGSVSGHQWTGPRLQTPEGFGVFDCRPDGSFEYAYESYGWQAKK